jgi:hypothetical protein
MQPRASCSPSPESRSLFNAPNESSVLQADLYHISHDGAFQFPRTILKRKFYSREIGADKSKRADAVYCAECGRGENGDSRSYGSGLRPAKVDENESKALHVFNGLGHVFDPECTGLTDFKRLPCIGTPGILLC